MSQADKHPLGWPEEQLKQFQEDEALYGEQFTARLSKSPYCGLCYIPDGPFCWSRMFPGDSVCSSCWDYEAWWLSLTPEQQRENDRVAVNGGEHEDR